MDKSTPRPERERGDAPDRWSRLQVTNAALVEALREATAMVDEYSCRTPVGHIASECEAVVRRARAALALAKETP